MKIFYSEGPNNYSNYLFSYQVLAVRDGDSKDAMYQAGFLPFRSIPELYYLSRSTRVNIENFAMSSENRRVMRTADQHSLKVVLLSEFTTDAHVEHMVSIFVQDIFGKRSNSSRVMIKRILSLHGNYNQVGTFTDSTGTLTGFCVLYISDKVVHYGHSFYDLKYRKDNLGLAMMTSVVDWAKQNAKQEVYLGTCYGQSAMYKSQYSGFEFFDGVKWSSNITQLKYLVGRDASKTETHVLSDPQYLEFYHAKSLSRFAKLVLHTQNDIK